MESKGLLTYPQQPPTGPYPEPDESSSIRTEHTATKHLLVELYISGVCDKYVIINPGLS
jgi:hypothetical protein